MTSRLFSIALAVAVSHGLARADAASCVPGQQIECACVHGKGVQACSPDGTYGACQCVEEAPVADRRANDATIPARDATSSSHHVTMRSPTMYKAGMGIIYAGVGLFFAGTVTWLAEDRFLSRKTTFSGPGSGGTYYDYCNVVGGDTPTCSGNLAGLYTGISLTAIGFVATLAVGLPLAVAGRKPPAALALVPRIAFAKTAAAAMWTVTLW